MIVKQKIEELLVKGKISWEELLPGSTSCKTIDHLVVNLQKTRTSAFLPLN